MTTWRSRQRAFSWTALNPAAVMTRSAWARWGATG